MGEDGQSRRLELMTRMDQRLMQVYLIFGALILLTGLAVTAFGFLFTDQVFAEDHSEFIDLAIKVAGFAMNVLALLPFKQGWAVYERLQILGEMKRAPGLLDPTEEDKLLRQLFIKRLGAQNGAE